MTETEASQAKSTYEALVSADTMFLLGHIVAIMAVAKMTKSDVNGAISNAGIVQPRQGAKKKASYYTPRDVLKLYFANKLAEEERERIAKKRVVGDSRFMWKNMNKGAINSMVMFKIDELFLGEELGQKVVKKMAEIAGFKAE